MSNNSPGPIGIFPIVLIIGVMIQNKHKILNQLSKLFNQLFLYFLAFCKFLFFIGSILFLGGLIVMFFMHLRRRYRERQAWTQETKAKLNTHEESIKELQVSSSDNSRDFRFIYNELSKLKVDLKEIKKITGIEAEKQLKKATMQLTEGFNEFTD